MSCSRRTRILPIFPTSNFSATGERPADDENWDKGGFALNGQTLDYYDYVRASLAGGKLEFDPVKEVHDMVDSNCNDLHYRSDAVEVAIAAGIENLPQPIASAAQHLRHRWRLGGLFDAVARCAAQGLVQGIARRRPQRFVEMYQRGDDPKLVYKGNDLVGDLIAAYDREAAACKLTYARTDSSQVTLGYERCARRLFLHVVRSLSLRRAPLGRHRCGELATCRDGEFQAGLVCGGTESAQPDRPHLRRRDGFLARRT